MDPIRINIVFDTQGRPQLQRAAQDLGAITGQLSALSANTSTAGRAFRVMENDLNRFAYTLHRTTSQGLSVFNSAFERTASLFGQATRLSFYAAIGQVAALGYGLRRLGQEFFDINEQFAGLEITLKSMFGSLTAARKVREELARITITSPLAFKDLADATRAAAAMPALAPKFAQQIQSDGLSNPDGFLRKYVGLLEKMTTFRPDKGTADAVFALREAISGELRSLVRRFEFPAALLVQSSGKPLEYLKQRPDEMLLAMQGAFSRLISDKATLEISRQPSRLFQNIVEQAIQIPLLQIGRAGEKNQGGPPSLYQRILDVGVSTLNRFGEFANVDKGAFGPRSQEMGVTLTRLFDSLLTKFDNLLERGLNAAGASQLDVPGGGKIERVYFVFQNALEYIEENLPSITEGFRTFFDTIKPIFSWFLGILKQMGSFLKAAFDIGPLTGVAALVALKSIPQIFRGMLTVIESSMVTTAQNVRSALLGLAASSSMLPGLLSAGAGSAIAGPNRGNMLGGVPGTLASTLGRNPFLYNRELLRQNGLEVNRAGQIVHSVDKQGATGYFGQTYNASRGASAGPEQLPASLMFQPNMRLEQQLSRAGMAFDPLRGQYVWAPGSGRPVGTRATPPANYTAALSNQGLPPGIRQNSAGQFVNQAGRFVSPNWVMSNLPSSVAVSGGEAMSRVFEHLRGAGTGRIAAGAAAGTAGLLTGMGASAGITGALSGAVGVGTAALVSTVTPVLLALVGTAVIYKLYDSVSAYAEGKRSSRGQEFLEESGLSANARSVLSKNVIAESDYGRRLSQFIKEATTDPALRQFSDGAARIASLTAPVIRPGTLRLTRDKSWDLAAPDPALKETLSVGSSERATNLDFAGITKFRSQLVADIEALSKMIASGEGDAITLAEPVPLRSVKGIQEVTIGPVNRDGSRNQTMEMVTEVSRRDTANEVVRYLRTLFQESTKQLNTIVQEADQQFKSPSGSPLLTRGTPLDEADQMRVDQWKATLDNLRTPAGFIDSSPQFEKIREGLKSYDLSPDMRQLTEGNDSTMTTFQEQFNPLKGMADIFERERVRMGNLVALQEKLTDVAIVPDLTDPRGLSGSQRALADQQANIDNILKSYFTMFGREAKDGQGKVRPVIDVPKLDASGAVVGTTPMLFEEYATEIRRKLTEEIAPRVVQDMTEEVGSKILEVPASAFQSTGLRIPALLESITEATDSVTQRTVTQITDNLKQLESLMVDSKNPIVSSFAPQVTEVARSLQQLPSADAATMPEERATIGYERSKTFLDVSTRLETIVANIRDTLPPALATEFANAAKAVGTGVTQFTSKLSEMADRLTKAAADMDDTRLEESFKTLMGGGIRSNTPLGQEQQEEAVTYARKRFGINLSKEDLAFTALPIDSERRSGPPQQRNAGLAKFIDETWVPELRQQADLLKGQIAEKPQDAGLKFRLAVVQNSIRSYQAESQQLTEEVTKSLSEYHLSELDRSLNVMREMTDPALGFKLSRRGSITPETQWQSGRFGQADKRTSILQEQFDDVNKGAGSPLSLRSDFKDALEIDTRGFRAVTGEVQRLIAFQKQYIQNSETLATMAQDPKYGPDQVRHLRDLSEAWGKLADEAERTKEAIVGNGGVLNSFVEGFGAVTSQWAATTANWTNIGATMAQTLSSSMSDSLIDIAIYSKDAGEAMRQFGATVAETAARLAMNKVVESIIGVLFSGLGNIGGLFGGGGATAGAASSVTGVTGTTLSSSIAAPSMSLTPMSTGGLVPAFADGGMVVNNQMFSETPIPGFSMGGSITSTIINNRHSPLAMQGGGKVPGYSSDKDNTLAYLASGEFVIPSRVVRKLGVDHFERYRKGPLPSFSDGGLFSNQSLPVNYSMPTLPTGNQSVSSVSAPVSVTVNIDNKGVSTQETEDPASTEERSRLLAKTLRSTVREEILNQQRPGGTLYQMGRSTRH